MDYLLVVVATAIATTTMVNLANHLDTGNFFKCSTMEEETNNHMAFSQCIQDSTVTIQIFELEPGKYMYNSMPRKTEVRFNGEMLILCKLYNMYYRYAHV